MEHTLDTSRILYETSTVKDGNMSFRFGEHDEVLSSRLRFLEKHGVALANVVEMKAEHLDTVVRVSAQTEPSTSQSVVGEALLTNVPGVVLLLLTADCLPVVYIDHEHEAIALAHLGRKPTEMHLASKVVASMKREFGTKPSELQVLIGPSIQKESYVFDSPQKVSDAWKNFHVRDREGRTHIDLAGFARQELVASGVLGEDIHLSPIDTAVSQDYFSHARVTRTGEKEGRFVTIVSIRK